MKQILVLCQTLTLLLLLPGAAAHAAVRASLQPDRVELGQTTTLTVESDESASAPDVSALQQDFEVRGQSRSTQFSIINGRSTERTLFSLALEPRRAGVLTVPTLQVGNASTDPLTLTVTPAAQASAEHGDAIYLETEIGTLAPYVQQAVPYTVRLFYAVQLVNGDVQAPAPENASLQKLGEDRNYQQEVNGRRYNVFERKFLLLPEKSGPLELPAAQFRGRAQSNDGDAFFGGVRAVSASSKSLPLNVRAQPANAPLPWLVADELQLTRNPLPDSARAGEPLLLELSLIADGATAAQLPELLLPPLDGAQVFPEPPQTKDTIVDGKPHASVTRRFAIVPAQSGPLKLAPMQLNYWNTVSDRADTVSLAATVLAITPGTAGASAPSVAPMAPFSSSNAAPRAALASNSATLAGSDRLAAVRFWQIATAATALLLVIALWWGWRRGPATRAPASGDSALPGPATSAQATIALRRALGEGDLDAIADALRRSTTPPSSSLGALLARIEDPAQRSAVQALERVLWAPAVDASQRQATREQLRAVFRSGPTLIAPNSAPGEQLLPPLYPSRP